VRKVRSRPLRTDRPQRRSEGRRSDRASQVSRCRTRRRETARRSDAQRIAVRRRRPFGPLMDRRELGAGTRVVRAARSLPPGGGRPVVPPLVQSVAFAYDSASEQDAVFGNERAGYVYGRYGTPTTAALEAVLAELEGAE